MATDTAGRTLGSARTVNLKSTKISLKEWVGIGDRDDIYKVSLKAGSSFNLNVKPSSRGVVAEFIRDLNGNGKISQNEILASTTASPTRAGALNRSKLSAGTYFVRVRAQGANTNYSLTMESPAVATVTTPTPTPTPAPSAFTSEVLRLTNLFRQQNGLQPLTLNSKLTAAAQTHSQNMGNLDFFSHTGADGSSSSQRVSASGYTWSAAGENIAAGYTTPDAVVNGWINSPGHRANILNANYRDIGIGYFYLAKDTGNVNWQSYWTQKFGKPA